MVIDSSAILAMFLGEPEREELLRKLERDPHRMISAGTLLEVQIVLDRIAGQGGLDRLAIFLLRADVDVVVFDHEQTMIAGAAYREYGRGRHAAGLNFGDCFAYALAKQTGEPLLCKGGDFGLTDVVVA